MSDPIWHIGVARIEVMIERYGICNVMGAVLQAIESIEEDQLRENPDFETLLTIRTCNIKNKLLSSQ